MTNVLLLLSLISYESFREDLEADYVTRDTIFKKCIDKWKEFETTAITELQRLRNEVIQSLFFSRHYCFIRKKMAVCSLNFCSDPLVL